MERLAISGYLLRPALPCPAMPCYVLACLVICQRLMLSPFKCEGIGVALRSDLASLRAAIAAT